MNTTGGCMSSMPLGYKSSLQGPYIAAELLIALAAVVGNLLVCLAVSWNRKLRTVTNYFLVSLSVADILVGLVAIPCAVLTDLGQPHNDLPLCLVLLSILMILTQSSILSMLAVAVERYVAILRPFHYQRVMSPRNARVALLLTWSLALVSGSVPLMDWQGQSHDAGYCLFTCVVDMTYMVYFNFFGLLLLPLLVMFVIYAHIFYTMRHQLRRIAMARGGPSPSEASPTPPPPPPAVVVSVTRGGVGGQRELGSVPQAGAPVGAADLGVGGAGQRITLRRAAGEEVGSPPVWSRPGAPRGGETTPRLEAQRGAGGAPDPGEPAVPGAPRHTFGPVIQTKTTAVFRKMSRPSTGTSRSGSDDRPPESNRPGAARARLEIQKATSLFLVLFLFMVCLMPIHLINCVLLLRPQCPVPMSITLAAILLSHANSALNPLLYAYRMRSFRHTLRGMCPWCSTPKRH